MSTPDHSCGFVEKGNRANKGARRDLFVVIHVKDHSFFERKGEHLVCEVPLSFVQAALGDVISIPGLGGETSHEIQIPEGTQPNDMLKIPGKGMPSLAGRDNRGDLYVKLVVKIPKKLNKRQRELLSGLRGQRGTYPLQEKKGKKFLEQNEKVASEIHSVSRDAWI